LERTNNSVFVQLEKNALEIWRKERLGDIRAVNYASGMLWQNWEDISMNQIDL